MKILSTDQIRDADAYTIEHEPISSIDLMERAATCFVQWFKAKFDASATIAIVCGTGNNGGDGLAIARMLISDGYAVSVNVIKVSEKSSPDFSLNYNRLKTLTSDIHEIVNDKAIPVFHEDHIIIDAIFGSGLTRPAEGIFGKVIKVMNKSNAKIVSVDIASGLFSDHFSEGENIVQPQYTLSFQFPKLAFLLPENEVYCGQVTVVDIGLDKNFIQDVVTDKILVNKKFVQGKIKKRKFFSHKGIYGRSLIIAGSKGKMGACVLATKACLRAGAGLVTAHVPKAGYDIIQIAAPEAMASVDKSGKIFCSPPDISTYDTIGIGPGLGTDERTANAFAEVLKHFDKPLVIDADGLNILGKNKDLLEIIPKNSILTPHLKEFERIAGTFKNDLERLALQKEFSSRYHVYLVFKGGYTTISTPDGKLFFNSTGNPGLATGGTGDVLTGIITSLLGQKYPPEDAALIGVFLHGLAGDIAATRKGTEALLASDVIDHLSEAFSYLTKKQNYWKPISFS